jgi:hypothetical protein
LHWQEFLFTRSPIEHDLFGLQIHLRDAPFPEQDHVLSRSLQKQFPGTTSLFGEHFSLRVRHLQDFFPAFVLLQNMNENRPEQKQVDLLAYAIYLLQAGTFLQVQVAPVQTRLKVRPLQAQKFVFGKVPLFKQTGSFLKHTQDGAAVATLLNFFEHLSFAGHIQVLCG